MRVSFEYGRQEVMDSVETWETPSFEEIEMNAEIGSYTPDFDGI